LSDNELHAAIEAALFTQRPTCCALVHLTRAQGALRAAHVEADRVGSLFASLVEAESRVVRAMTYAVARSILTDPEPGSASPVVPASDGAQATPGASGGAGAEPPEVTSVGGCLPCKRKIKELCYRPATADFKGCSNFVAGVAEGDTRPRCAGDLSTFGLYGHGTPPPWVDNCPVLEPVDAATCGNCASFSLMTGKCSRNHDPHGCGGVDFCERIAKSPRPDASEWCSRCTRKDCEGCEL
jgi:hypothetical protein